MGGFKIGCGGKVRCNTWGSKVRRYSAAKNQPSARHACIISYLKPTIFPFKGILKRLLNTNKLKLPLFSMLNTFFRSLQRIFFGGSTFSFCPR